MRGGEAALGPVLPVLLRAAGGQRGEAGHEEVEAGEGNHVDRQLPQVSVQLAGEPEAGGHAWTQILIVITGTSGRYNYNSPDIVSDTRWLRSP